MAGQPLSCPATALPLPRAAPPLPRLPCCCTPARALGEFVEKERVDDRSHRQGRRSRIDCVGLQVSHSVVVLVLHPGWICLDETTSRPPRANDSATESNPNMEMHAKKRAERRERDHAVARVVIL